MPPSDADLQPQQTGSSGQLAASHIDFPEISAIAIEIEKATGGWESFRDRLRTLFRDAIDEVIDTPRTNRVHLSDLEKTEKTYLGTKFEILVRDWLGFGKGRRLDLQIGDYEVDIKTTTGGGYDWMIPREARNQLCLLISVNDETYRCHVGLVRARETYLRVRPNQDKKTSLSAAGAKNIWWLVLDYPYEGNFWASLGAETRRQLIRSGGGKKQLALFFEEFIGRPVSRRKIQVLAPQDDFMRRIRRNGGARDILSPKGIAIFYTEHDRDLMLRLGLAPGYREFVSYRPKNIEEERWLREAGHID